MKGGVNNEYIQYYSIFTERVIMHYKLSKNEWLAIGSKSGWLKSGDSRSDAKTKITAEIAADPRDKYFEKLKTLKGVLHQGKGFYIIPEKLITPARRAKLLSNSSSTRMSTQRYELSHMGDFVGWGTGHPNVNDYRLKDWIEAFL